MRSFLTLALLLPGLQAQEPLGALLSRAREHRDAGNLAASLQAYDAMLAQVADHETALLERAQVLSWMGRYDEALVGYRAYRQRYPRQSHGADLRIAQVLAWSDRIPQALDTLASRVAQGDRQAVLDDATYRSWRGDLAQALDRLDTWLKGHPEDREALLLQARIRSWLGRWNESREAYGRVLALEAQDAQALLGLGRLELWSGNPRGARTQVARLRPEDRTLPEARILEAQTLAAEGHPRAARRSTLPLLQGGSAQRDAQLLVDEFIEGQGFWVDLHHSRTETNEGLTTETPGLTVRVPVGDGRLDLEAGRSEVQFQDQKRTLGSLGLSMAYPLGAWGSLDAGAVRVQDFGGAPGSTVRAGLGLRLAPALHLRLDGSRSLLDFTPRAIDRRGSISALDASLAWTFGQGRNSLTLGGGQGNLSAGSTRRTFFVSLEHRKPWSHGDLRAGALIRGMGYSETLALGFFNPERYRYAALTLGASYRRLRRFEASLDARGGRQSVNGGASQFAWSYSGLVTWRPEALPLGVFVGWSESVAGLPVVDPTDARAYREKTLRFGLRLTQPRTSRVF